MHVYKVVNLINNKIYIGKEKKSDRDYYGSGLLISRAINKYGKQYFKKVILCICRNYKEMNGKEKYWIDKLNTTDVNRGYNIMLGGDGGDYLTNHPERDQIIKKMSSSHKGRKKSIEMRRKLSKSISGENHHQYGRKRSKETRIKISKGMRKNNPMFNTKIREKHANIMRDRFSGKNNPMFGIRHSAEALNTISLSQKGIPKTEDHKKNISEALKAFHRRKKSEVHRKSKDEGEWNSMCYPTNR